MLSIAEDIKILFELMEIFNFEQAKFSAFFYSRGFDFDMRGNQIW